jgi:hypothetical protein
VDTITGGTLILPATSESVASFIAAAEAAPEELSPIANLMPAPPMLPLIPGRRGITRGYQNNATEPRTSSVFNQNIQPASNG